MASAAQCQPHARGTRSPGLAGAEGERLHLLTLGVFFNTNDQFSKSPGTKWPSNNSILTLTTHS